MILKKSKTRSPCSVKSAFRATTLVAKCCEHVVEYCGSNVDAKMKPTLERLDGERESLKEYFILREKAVQPPVELHSIESDALVAESQLVLCLIKTAQVVKSHHDSLRWENVLFDTHMSIRRHAALHDLWSSVASTADELQRTDE